MRSVCEEGRRLVLVSVLRCNCAALLFEDDRLLPAPYANSCGPTGSLRSASNPASRQEKQEPMAMILGCLPTSRFESWSTECQAFGEALCTARVGKKIGVTKHRKDMASMKVYLRRLGASEAKAREFPRVC